MPICLHIIGSVAAFVLQGAQLSSWHRDQEAHKAQCLLSGNLQEKFAALQAGTVSTCMLTAQTHW